MTCAGILDEPWLIPSSPGSPLSRMQPNENRSGTPSVVRISVGRLQTLPNLLLPCSRRLAGMILARVAVAKSSRSAASSEDLSGGQDNPGDDQTDDTESQARQKLNADPDPEERHAETQNSLRAHGDPRHATTFLCKEMEGNTEQQRHQHRRRTVMIREESGGYGDNDRDKEPRHEQYQVLRQVKP